ncbi:MAG TPA: GTPase HflX, partial [Fibrobacteraceae bacterium]|nr:GTPase HflX [Fibrobacteraceae bacterium]
LIGAGKVAEIASRTKDLAADLVVFDEDLSGSQIKNLEESLPGVKVLDRTGLILDIFARHARTAESRIMVEIAQMEYTLPRLTRAWTHLCRQVGGIGTRGPGETQLEVDRRSIRTRIQALKKKLRKIEDTRDMQAERRGDIFHVAIVGYTNAGKSTLTNRLTGAGVLVEDKLFATLDSTTRKLFLEPGHPIILSDTVGFIRKLPHHLVDTFRSTLGVVSHADCILEVLDSAAPDYREHMEVTQQVLHGLTAPEIPRIRIFNKADTTSMEQREDLCCHFPEALQVSALANVGMEILKQRLIELEQSWQEHRRIVANSTQQKALERAEEIAQFLNLDRPSLPLTKK